MRVKPLARIGHKTHCVRYTNKSPMTGFYRIARIVLCLTADEAADWLHRFMRREIGDDTLTVEHLYDLREDEAVTHLFQVASGLDSMVLGEAQILGQVKDAYRAAVRARSCGPVLNRLFERLAKAVGRPELLSEFPRETAYMDRWQDLRQRFADIFSAQTADHWESTLSAEGVPVGQVRHLSEVFTNPQLEFRQAVTDVAGQRHLNAGFQVDGQPTAPSRSAEHIGQSTSEVLGELGMSDARTQELLRQGAVYQYDSK